MKNEKLKGLVPYIKILCFILAFAIIIEALSLTVFSNAGAVNYKNKYSNAMSFYDDAENTLQIVAIGNSDLYSGFCPDVLWASKGYTSTAIGAPRQSVARSYNLLLEVYKRQQPDVVIIECDMFYDSQTKENNVAENEKIIDFFSNFDSENFDGLIKDNITIFTFHDKWKKKKRLSNHYNTHGYRFNRAVVSFDLDKNFMKPTDKLDPVIGYNRKNLDKIVELCRENGTEIILTTFPSPASWSYSRHNAIDEYAKENDIPFIDYNLLFDEIKIDCEKDFRDLGNHLNYAGARKVSRHLANFLAENYSLDSKKKDSNYASWVEDHKKFLKLVKSKKKRI